MDFIKKQGVGTWVSIGAVIVSIIALIIYGAALSAGTNLTIASGSEVFYEATRAADAVMLSTVVACSVVALVLLVAAIVLGQLKLEGIAAKLCDTIGGAFRIVAPALLIVALINFVYGSFTGLGWTFFSNEELEIYPEAIAVGKQVIVGLIFFGIAAVAAIVASFFAIVKKEQA